MINESIVYVDNFWTEGFETTANGMEIQVAAGKFFQDVSILNPETEEVLIAQKVMEYPAFSFDVEADLDFDVIYDVHLLDLPSISGEEIVIDRTILGYDQIAAYEGTDQLKFMLMSFMVGIGSVDLDNTNIIVKKAAKQNEENSGQ